MTAAPRVVSFSRDVQIARLVDGIRDLEQIPNADDALALAASTELHIAHLLVTADAIAADLIARGQRAPTEQPVDDDEDVGMPAALATVTTILVLLGSALWMSAMHWAGQGRGLW